MKKARVIFAIAVLLFTSFPLMAGCETWGCVTGEGYASCQILFCNNPPCTGQISYSQSLFCQGICDGRGLGCWCRQSGFCYDI